MPDIYTKVKVSEYRNLLTQNKSLKEENAILKAKIESLENVAKEVIEPIEEKEEITKKETKKGGNK